MSEVNWAASAAVVTPGTAESVAARLKSFAERPTGLTVGALIDRYMAQYAGRDRTRAQRLSAWHAMIGLRGIESVDGDVIFACRQELASQPALSFKGRDFAGNRIFRAKQPRKGKSAATLNRYTVALAAVFTWAIEHRLTPKGWVNPCRGIRRLKESDGRVRFLDAEERARLFDAVKASRYPRLYALVLMAMATGARKGELLSLRWSDVRLDEGVAYLAGTKNGDSRTLVLLPQVVDALRAFADSDSQRFVFGSQRTKYQTPAVLGSTWRDAVERAGLVNFRFHDLRHCCASYLAQAGTPLNVIADVLGHRRLDMSRRYAHLTTQTKAQAMRAALGAL